MPTIGKNEATTKTQIAKILPNVCIVPSALLEEKRTKYPITRKTVAGMKLKKNTELT